MSTDSGAVSGILLRTNGVEVSIRDDFLVTPLEHVDDALELVRVVDRRSGVVFGKRIFHQQILPRSAARVFDDLSVPHGDDFGKVKVGVEFEESDEEFAFGLLIVLRGHPSTESSNLSFQILQLLVEALGSLRIGSRRRRQANLFRDALLEDVRRHEWRLTSGLQEEDDHERQRVRGDGLISRFVDVVGFGPFLDGPEERESAIVGAIEERSKEAGIANGGGVFDAEIASDAVDFELDERHFGSPHELHVTNPMTTDLDIAIADSRMNRL